MPLNYRHDASGHYVIWGSKKKHGKPYYYTKGDDKSLQRAKNRAMAQARAIERSKALRNR